MDIKV